MKHFTKGQSGKIGKTKEQILYCQKKPKVKPLLNRKGNKRLNKKNDKWHLIRKKWTPST